MAKDPDTAPRTSIDRFSADAGHLFVRDGSNGLPAANAPIDFDQEPFVSHGFGPNGELVTYYNFDVQPTGPAPIYVLFREGESSPVEGQLNIVGVVPGETGYNDFWQVVKVTVPSNYVANSVTSVDEIEEAGYQLETTSTLVNCPIVPEGSTATQGMNGAQQLTRGWYEGEVVFYFNFDEAALSTKADGTVPLAGIYVSFNVNPGEDGGGPASGFKTEEGTTQTHNVVATLPTDDGYSPLWSVNPYDNADFLEVHNLAEAMSANVLAMGASLVNCPIVAVSEGPHQVDAEEQEIDRFSADAGHLFVRDGANGLPAAGEPIDFDQEPFISHGLGPAGQNVTYYNFDVQSNSPAHIYVLFREGADHPVPGQLNIVDVVPGDPGYSDFWRVIKVTVPADYVANTAASEDELMAAGYDMEITGTLVNCPIVPEGSTAALAFGGAGPQALHEGWYKGKTIYYFNFDEKALTVTADALVPVSPIYVSFNINPGQNGGGPPSGFKTETGTTQTHNVTATIPSDDAYSPLWDVNVYDNAAFGSVMDLASAQAATVLGNGGTVNCPIVEAQ